MPSHYQSHIGKPVVNVGDIALMGQQYVSQGSTEPYEKLSHFYILNDAILGHKAITSDAPYTVSPMPDTFSALRRYKKGKLPGSKLGFVDIHDHWPAITSRPSLSWARFDSQGNFVGHGSDIRYMSQMERLHPDEYYGSMVFNQRGTRFSFVPSQATPQHWITPEMEQYKQYVYRDHYDAGSYRAAKPHDVLMYVDVPTRVLEKNLPPKTPLGFRVPQAPLGPTRVIHQTESILPPKGKSFPGVPLTPPPIPSNRY